MAYAYELAGASAEERSLSKAAFVSLFSGAGGLDIGLEAAGWRAQYASDIDSHAVETLKLNVANGKGHLSEAFVEQADVRRLTGSELLSKAGATRGGIPLLVGGPPCQSWSSAGH